MIAHVRDACSGSDDRRSNIDEIIPPIQIIEEFPNTEENVLLIIQTREEIGRIIDGVSDKKLVIVGPCSIHDPDAALEYAQSVKKWQQKYPNLLLVMRVYFEKPRTTVGWKGLINDPDLDSSCDIEKGVHIARKLLLDINSLGVPTASEALDPISPQYIGDLISWWAIGARTTESQTHREIASGLSAPVGFKNGTDGGMQVAIDAIKASSQPHTFFGISKAGKVARIETEGNPVTHVILRGGKVPNYGEGSVQGIVSQLQDSGLPPRVMIDASHGNSMKNHKNQGKVIASVANQIRQNASSIIGVMIESNLVEGKQSYTPGEDDSTTLQYGVSITDACIGLDETDSLLGILHKAIGGHQQNPRTSGISLDEAYEVALNAAGDIGTNADLT